MQHQPSLREQMITAARRWLTAENVAFAALCATAVMTTDHGMTDPHITAQNAYAALMASVLLAVLCAKIVMGKDISLHHSQLATIFTAVCLCEAAMTFWNEDFNITIGGTKGHFDNPAGFAACMSCGFAMAAHRAAQVQPLMRRCTWAAVAAVLLAGTVLSGCRSGMVACGAVTAALCLIKAPRRHRPVVAMAVAAIAMAAAIALYYIKPASADGRVLIWQATLDMISQKPLLGWGAGAFKAHYMDFQAARLTAHPNAAAAMLADNVPFAYCEYLNLAACYGLAGIAALAAGVWWLIVRHRQAPTPHKACALLTLLAIGAFSPTSYPTAYAVTQVAMLMSLTPFVSIGKGIPKAALVAACCCAAIGLAANGFRISALHKWGRLSQSAPTRSVLNGYAQLTATLGDDPYFLYNYAVMQLDAGKTDEALQTAEKCSTHWADYDLELLLADINSTRHNTPQAIAHYRKAGEMCPNRFVPPYELMQIYAASGNRAMACRYAHLITTKPIKVDSPTVRHIISDARSLLHAPTGK